MSPRYHQAGPGLMTTAEAAALFRVSLGTIRRWAEEGKLGSFVKPGGSHYRLYEAHVNHAYQGGTFDAEGNPQP